MNGSEGKVRGKVVEVLPNHRYRVELEGGRAIEARVGRELRAKLVRLIPGSEVLVELSRYDHCRGRIVDQVR